MGEKTAIQWTKSTWNPVTGCTKVSEGCRNCYAERESRHLQRMGVKRYAAGFTPTIHPEALADPAKWKQPRLIFTVSMGDLFESHVPDSFILEVFKTIEEVAPWHVYQLLSKRPLRVLNFQRRYFPDGFPKNTWIGTSIEDNRVVRRADFLRQVKVKSGIRFLSCEPLIGPVDRLDLAGIGWVIGGFESGPSFRPGNPDWARWLRDECIRLGIPFFWKQNGGRRPKSGGRSLDGREWSETP
ncbi:MAG: phage Gp37/Gp68 family protein [Nitrososphaerota archaeon]|nr:phage Gp37/Gp68 family protein [Nitrososphaerota archaeon]MDG6990412.1 phage Gp37/Gp68 family protein [Nitrososphaerota archaeon]